MTEPVEAKAEGGAPATSNGVERGQAAASAAASNAKAARANVEIDQANRVELVLKQTLIGGHQKHISCVAFSSDGTKIASCSADASVVIWDVSTGDMIRKLDSSTAGELKGHEKKGISFVAWQSGSDKLCTASDDKTLCLWDTRTGECIQRFIGHTHFVLCCDVSPSGALLVSGSVDEIVKLWDVRTGVCVKDMPAHSDPVTAVRFNSDASLFVSSSYDGLCRIWNTFTGRCYQTVYAKGHAPVASVRFSPCSKFILVNSLESSVQAIRLWDINHQQWVKKYEGHVNKSYALGGEFLDVKRAHAGWEGLFVVCGSEDGAIVMWDAITMKAVGIQAGASIGAGDESGGSHNGGHTAPVLSITCHPTAPIFASGAMAGDLTVKIWEARRAARA